MDEDTQKVDVDTSTNEAGDGATTEDVTKEATQEEKDYASLYENQKVRAEKAEAELKKLRESSTSNTYDPEAIRKEAEEAAKRTLDQQYIEEQGFSDEIKSAIETVAKVQGVSLRQAAQDGYVQSLVQEHQRQQKVQNASPDSGGGGDTGYTFDPENPPDVDVSTPEGQKAIEEWETQLERHRSS